MITTPVALIHGERDALVACVSRRHHHCPAHLALRPAAGKQKAGKPGREAAQAAGLSCRATSKARDLIFNR
jgi:hypothetical protein